MPETIEGKVLQDADRLDAIGAIGIARCFATCAEMRVPFYNPDDPFCGVREPDDKRWGLDHFYRKLLRIPDGLHTATARAIAKDRNRPRPSQASMTITLMRIPERSWAISDLKSQIANGRPEMF